LLSFVEHRHDQSIFTLLKIVSGRGLAIKNENYFPNLWAKKEHPKFAPIAAFRNKYNYSLIKNFKLIDFKESISAPFITEYEFTEQKSISNFDFSKLDHEIFNDRGLTNLEQIINSEEYKANELLIQNLNKESLFDLLDMENNLLKSEITLKETKIIAQSNSLIEKQKVINEMAQSLEDRLNALKQNAIDNEIMANKIHKLDLIIAKNTQLFNLYELNSSFEIVKFFLRRLKHDSKKYIRIVLAKFLHQLRVLKHFLVHLPEGFLYWRDILISKYYSLYRSLTLQNKLGSLIQHHPKKIMLLKAPSYNFPLNRNYPKITIVTPSYKQSIYIERTILSIINQNYPNLEYIIRDGLSEDGTSEIVNKYKKNIYQYYSQKDLGQANAINLGFSESSGEIMAWLNSDDLYLPHTFIKVISIFNDHPEIDVVYGHRIIIDENDQQIGRWIMPKHNSEVLNWADYIPQETLFWRRKIWDKIGKSLDEDFQFAMDWNLILKFKAAGANFFRINDYLACFRIHTAQKTSASINSVGAKEMGWLRENSLGFNPTSEEINIALTPYLKEHRILDLLWGFLGRDKI